MEAILYSGRVFVSKWNEGDRFPIEARVRVSRLHPPVSMIREKGQRRFPRRMYSVERKKKNIFDSPYLTAIKEKLFLSASIKERRTFFLVCDEEKCPFFEGLAVYCLEIRLDHRNP